MVGITSTPESYSVTARPNCSLTWWGRVAILAAIAALTSAVAMVFWLFGAWVVAPFAGAELVAFGCAFLYLERRAADYERVTIEGSGLVVEKHQAGETSRYEFQRYWARIALRRLPNGDKRLCVSSHGKEVELGQYMNDEERLAIAEQLKTRIGSQSF